MRSVVIVLVLALCVAPAASAKLEVALSVSNVAPRAYEPLRAVLRTEERGPASCKMQLLAIAPGVNTFRALDAFINGGYGVIGPSGPSFRKVEPTPRMGFLVAMKRVGPQTWRVTIRLPRAGAWRLVVPNTCAPGYMSPLPAVRTVAVR